MNKFSSLLSKTAKMSLAIFINKPIGLLRDILRIRYFGVTILADAFSMAWRLPNTLRKLFGEGALASTLVPSIIELEKKEGKDSVNELTTALFFIFQFIVLIVCFLIGYFSYSIISLIAPGSPDRILYAVPMLKILIYFTFFMSGSVILGSTLQSINQFMIGPMSQFFLNIGLVIQFALSIYFKLTPNILCMMILSNGLIILGMHYYSYRKHGFYLKIPTKKIIPYVNSFFKKLIPSLLGVGVSEINNFIDQGMASYLEAGSQSMFDYVSAFIRIPLQIFGSSFATVSISYFSELAISNPKRFSYYLYESIISIIFTTLPFIILFLFFSFNILETLLLSDKFTIEHVHNASILLQLFSFIILFSSLNRVLLNTYYAFHKTGLPTFFSFLSTCLNTILNYFFIFKYGLKGIIFATVISELFRTILLLYGIYYILHIWIPLKRISLFILKNSIYLLSLTFIGGAIYNITYILIYYTFKKNIQYYLYHTIFYWSWTGLIILLIGYIYIKNNSKYKIKGIFIPKI